MNDKMETKKKLRVGDLLVEKGLITEAQLMDALAEQKRTGKKIGRVLTDLKFVSEDKLLSCLSDYFHYPYVDLNRYRIQADIVRILPEAYARRYRCIVLAEQANGVLIGLSDPTDLMIIDDLQRQLKQPVLPAFISEDNLLTTLDSIYRRQDEIASIAGELEGELSESDFDIKNLALGIDSSEAPVVRLLQSIFEDAVQVKASDIHIEPEEFQLRIRMRIDGDLHEQVMKEHRIASALVSRLKIMSGLDISEKRVPQDGRFNIRVRQQSIDVRVSTMPVQFGESVVMRLLDQSSGILDFDSLGMPKDIQERFNYLIQRPHGMILVTGPTGSGKTTTLYAALALLNTQERKIITAEDPIEYRLPRVNQVQIHTKVGLTFPTVLRAALRQDPDVILVGEMRDNETAGIGLRAAMTGHMVLSTLHTNDAVSTAMRLLDMGVDHYLVASSLRAVMAQRLIKRLCEHCQENHELEEQERAWLMSMTEDPLQASYKKGRGCHHCHNSGYSGRMGIYELLEMDDAMITAMRRNSADEFSSAANAHPRFRPLALCALDYARQGITSLDEVFRVSASLGDGG
ncbi:MAG: MSHA biogenesis protein MshE [Oleispira sp.]|jgi:MSHA biogenesis protein MshE